MIMLDLVLARGRCCVPVTGEVWASRFSLHDDGSRTVTVQTARDHDVKY